MLSRIRKKLCLTSRLEFRVYWGLSCGSHSRSECNHRDAICFTGSKAKLTKISTLPYKIFSLLSIYTALGKELIEEQDVLFEEIIHLNQSKVD